MQLDFSVTVFDDRPALANHQFFPREVTLQAEVWEKLLALPLPAAPSFGLIVTRGHRHDALVLKEWIHRPFLFLGMIGSARKARTMFEHFAEEKLATPEELQRVACPVGVKIRSQSVQEIAVSIMAQFIDKRAELVYGKQGSPVRVERTCLNRHEDRLARRRQRERHFGSGRAEGGDGIANGLAHGDRQHEAAVRLPLCCHRPRPSARRS